MNQYIGSLMAKLMGLVATAPVLPLSVGEVIGVPFLVALTVVIIAIISLYSQSN